MSEQKGQAVLAQLWVAPEGHLSPWLHLVPAGASFGLYWGLTSLSLPAPSAFITSLRKEAMGANLKSPLSEHSVRQTLSQSCDFWASQFGSLEHTD